MKSINGKLFKYYKSIFPATQTEGIYKRSFYSKMDQNLTVWGGESIIQEKKNDLKILYLK